MILLRLRLHANLRAIGTFLGAVLLGGMTVEAESPSSASKPGFSAIGLFDISNLIPSPKKIHESIYQATGISNTTMVTTKQGNVIIDTSLAQVAGMHKKTLTRANSQPVRYILLTHAHKDHIGGIGIWKGKDTEIVAHKNCVEFLNYQGRLAGFFARRNSAQFAVSLPNEMPKGNFGAKIDATVLFEKEYSFSLGGIDFELHHTPGETYDHVSIWIPQFKAAFVGDNYYRSFPNLYTPRGTKPRWALDYVDSLNKVISWEPELLISGHSPALAGKQAIEDALTRYRDAILYVHDETVKGMNEGKSVHTLMREIGLPEELRQDEKYGSVRWSVRGIYEGYAGWFDGNPASMYSQPISETYPDLVEMAGGPTAVAQQARLRVNEGNILGGLHMADLALAADGENRIALEVRLAALEYLAENSKNAIELGWLLHGIRDASSRLKHLPAAVPEIVQVQFTSTEQERTELALGTRPAKESELGDPPGTNTQ